jgi:hypothetical protein
MDALLSETNRTVNRFRAGGSGVKGIVEKRNPCEVKSHGSTKLPVSTTKLPVDYA